MRTRYALMTSALVFGVLLLAPCAQAGEMRRAPAEQPAARPKDDARAAFALALTLAAEGQSEAAQAAYAHVLRIDTEHAAARRALGYERVGRQWLRGDALLAARGLVQDEQGVRLVEATQRPRRELSKSVQARPRVDAAALYRRNLQRALRGSTPKARATATEDLKRAAHSGTARDLGRALWHRSDDVAVHAAEALARLGDKSGVAQLFARLRGNNSTSPRAYFSQLKQVPYIQDFDVEVG